MNLREEVEEQVKNQGEEENDEEVPTTPSDMLLNVTGFLESIGDRPVFTQKLCTTQLVSPYLSKKVKGEAERLLR